VVSGISKKDWLSLILGAAFLVLVVAMVIYSVVQRKRYPLEDPDLDKQVTHNFKEGIKGSGITFLIIGIGFRRGDSFQRRKVSRISLLISTIHC